MAPHHKSRTVNLQRLRSRQARAELRQRKYRYLYQVRTAHGDIISQVRPRKYRGQYYVLIFVGLKPRDCRAGRPCVRPDRGVACQGTAPGRSPPASDGQLPRDSSESATWPVNDVHQALVFFYLGPFCPLRALRDRQR